MRTLYIEEIDGDTSFQDVLLLVKDAGDIRNKYTERIFQEYWLPNKNTSYTGSDFVMYIIKETDAYMNTKTGERAEYYEETSYKVEIDHRGIIQKIIRTYFVRINGVIQKNIPENKKFNEFEITNENIPEEFRLKVNDISKFKIKNGVSPRQMEAEKNKKDSRYINLFIAGATAAGNMVLSRFPGGRQVVTGIGAIANFIVTVESPTDPKNIRVISIYKEEK